MKDQFLQLNGRTKKGLNFVADLWSGRVHRTLHMVYNTLMEFQQWRYEMTKNEQKILDAASVISETATNLTSGIQGLKDTIIDLKNQLGQPVAEEDLSPEFDKLDTALDSLKNLSDNLTTHVAENPSPNNDTLPATPPTTDVSVSTPTTTQPGEPEAPGATVQPVVPADPAPPTPEPVTPTETPVDVTPTPPTTDVTTPADTTVPIVPPAPQVPDTGPSIPVTSIPDTGATVPADTVPATSQPQTAPNEDFD